MEGTGPANSCHGSAWAYRGCYDALNPTLRFRGCTPGEREQQNAARISAVDDKVGDTMHYGVGFAGACPGNHQKWACDIGACRDNAMLYRSALFSIQERKVGSFRLCGVNDLGQCIPLVWMFLRGFERREL